MSVQYPRYSPLRMALGLVLAGVLGVLALALTVLFLIPMIIVGASAFAWLMWKARGLEREMTAAREPRDHPGDGTVIETEYTVLEEETKRISSGGS